MVGSVQKYRHSDRSRDWGDEEYLKKLTNIVSVAGFDLGHRLMAVIAAFALGEGWAFVDRS